MITLELLTLDGDYTPKEIVAYLDECLKEERAEKEKQNKQK